MKTKISIKAEFEPHKLELKDNNLRKDCVAAVGHQLLCCAGITPPSVLEINNAYGRSGNGFRFLSTFIEKNFPQLEAKHETNDIDTYLQKCSEILGKKIPVGISPGDGPNEGHVAVLVEVDNQEETLEWWEAQSEQYRKVSKEEFYKRKNRTYETFYLVKKNNSF